MIVRDLRKAIIHYLGYDPEEKVRQKADKNSAEIDEWNVTEKQPTNEELESIIVNNKESWKSAKVEAYKRARIITLKEKIYIRQQINEDYAEFQSELDELEN